MPQVDQETLITIYTQLQSQANLAHRVGYEDALQQLLYFDILTAIGIPPSASVLDVGCGRGDLYAYLHDRGHTGRYVGLDPMHHFVGEAQKRFPEAEFVVGDISSAKLDRYDYVLACSVFDYRTPNSQEIWQNAIARMFTLARCGIAWNGLTQIPNGRHDLWAQSMPEVLELCATLGSHYTIRCDYDCLHFTTYVYKREHFYTDSLITLIGYLYTHPEYAQKLQNKPLECAMQFGVSLQQLNLITPLWAT